MSRIVLQPVGSWLSESFGRLRDRWTTLSLLAVFGAWVVALGVVLVYALAFGFIGVLQGWDNLVHLFLDPRKLRYIREESPGMVTLFNGLALLVALRLYGWVFLAAVHASIEPSPRFGAVLRRGRGRGYAFMALFVVQQAIVQAGALLLIVPGLVLAVWLGFACWAFAREGTGVFASLGASARAVRGHFFGVLGRMLVAGLVGAVIMIVPLAGWLIGGAFLMVAWGALYDELRPALQPAPAPARPRPAGLPVPARPQPAPR